MCSIRFGTLLGELALFGDCPLFGSGERAVVLSERRFCFGEMRRGLCGTSEFGEGFGKQIASHEPVSGLLVENGWCDAFQLFERGVVAVESQQSQRQIQLVVDSAVLEADEILQELHGLFGVSQVLRAVQQQTHQFVARREMIGSQLLSELPVGESEFWVLEFGLILPAQRQQVRADLTIGGRSGLQRFVEVVNRVRPIGLNRFKQRERVKAGPPAIRGHELWATIQRTNVSVRDGRTGFGETWNRKPRLSQFAI